MYRRGYHARMITPPAVVGHEFAGTITEMAEDVADWEIGDRVVAANSAPCGECPYCKNHQPNLCDDLLFLNGAYAESIVVPARIVEKNLLPLSTDTAFADAALTEPLACVVQGADDCELQAGQRSLIIGSGNLPGPFEIGIVQPHELHIARLLHLGINPGMMLAQASDAQHGHFHNIRHAGKGRHSGRLVQG